MESTKMNFFQQIYYAIVKPKQYYKLTKVSSMRFTGFIFLFVLILTIFSIVIPIIDVFSGSDGIFQIIEEELPDFEMKNGKLLVEDRYEVSDNDFYLLVDTDIEKFDLDDIEGNYDQVVLISKTNLIQKQSMNRIQVLNFSNFRGFDFNNSIIHVFKPYIYIILVIIVLVAYIFLVGCFYFTGLLYSLIGLLVSSISNTRLSFERIFKTAIYSKVAIQLLFIFIGLFDSSMPKSAKNIIAIIVTCTYVVFGILSHKSDEANSNNNFDMIHNNYYNNNNLPS